MPRKKRKTVEPELPVKKRIRRTKAQIEADRLAELAKQEQDQQPKKRRRKRKEQAVEKEIVQSITKKRTRRTKAQMEADRQKLNNVPIVKRTIDTQTPVKIKKRRSKKVSKIDEVEDRRYIDEALKNAKPKGTIIRFHNYVISKFDDKNLCIEYKPKENASMFIGYANNTVDGFIRALETVAGKLITDLTSPAKANALSNLNLLLMALHDFKLFLTNKFIVKKDDCR